MVGIPAYNEASSIGSIVKSALSYCNEVIVCDDGSIDATAQEAKAAGARVVSHHVNKGYGAAIKTLFETAKGCDADILVTLDSDGQHEPKQIPDVIKPILEGECDIVIGSRFLNEADRKLVPAYRSFGIKTITRLSQITSYYSHLTDAQSGFRAYSKSALSKIDIVHEGMSVSTEILTRAGQKHLVIKEVPITINYDVADASTHNPLRHGLSIVGTIISFISVHHPLAFYGIPGLAFLIIGGYFMTTAMDLFSDTRYVSTNMIIISIGAALIGIVLIVTGVILNTLAAMLKERFRDRLT